MDDFINVRLETRKVNRGMAVANLQGKFKPIYSTKKLPSREQLWEFVVSSIGENSKVSLLEFGVYEGRSMKFWSEHFSNSGSEFHGFDSFVGLPEDWAGAMNKGTFSVDGRAPKIEDDRVSFHNGWFQNTVKPFLDESSDKLGGDLIVHFDADLYSASLFLLGNLWQYFDDYYFIFDEFFNDENRALSDFMSAYPCKVEFFGYAENRERHPGQVFGRMKKVPFEID